MSKSCLEILPVGLGVSVAERLMVIVGVLPTCHLIWRTVLSSKLGKRDNLPCLHVWIADWIIRPRLLLILAVALASGFICALLLKKDHYVVRIVLGILSTFVLVFTLCLSALAMTALLFPIQGLHPMP